MQKRMYRATDVKKVKLDPLKEQVHGQRVVFGVDVAKTTVYGALLNEVSTLTLFRPSLPGIFRALFRGCGLNFRIFSSSDEFGRS